MRTNLIVVLKSYLLPSVLASLFFIPLPAFAQGPDLSAAKVCAVNAPQSILCTITITNIGNNASVSPMSLTDNVTASTSVNFTGGGGSLPASCTPGAQVINNVPINCGIATSLAPGASGTVLFSFTMPTGGQFTNCVSVTQAQNPMTPADPNTSNNTNICTTITVAPPAPATGSITIIKDAQPNDAQNFTFTSNQASIAPFPLDDDSDNTLADRRTFTGLPAGSYTFTETQVTGWTLSSISCTTTSNATTSTSIVSAMASITLTAGSDVTCTFVNTKAATGSLTIIKDSQPDNAQVFTFTASGAGLSNFTLDDDGNTTNAFSNSVTFNNLAAGIALTVTEDAITGWSVPSLQCIPTVPGLTTVFTDQANRTFTVNLEAGAHVTCTFINVFTAPTTGSITIIKDTQPNDAQNFTFTSNQAGIAPFPLDDDSDNTLADRRTFTGLPAGSYTFTETQISGWTLSSIACTATASATTSTSIVTAMASITLTAGSNVTCTFSNIMSPPAPTAKICGVKFNDLNGNGLQDAGELGLANWQISLGNAAMPPVTTGSKGEYCISGLPAGTYTVGEILQAPWLQTFPVAPGTHTLTLSAGQQLNGINFGNTTPSGVCNSLSGSSYVLLGNGSFETAPLVTPGTFSFVDQALMPSWDTTAADGLMEVWSNGYGSIPAYSGNHFLELNAKVGATVYQSFTAVPGSTVTISFAHRGRAGFPNQMSVSLGAVGSLPATLGTYTASTSAWTLNSISYTFPNNGQTAYQIGFVAGDTGAGGNFLDDIQMIDVACLDAVVTDSSTLGKPKVFTYVESTYPHLFKGSGTPGQTGPYTYRFYAQTNNYLAIDDMGSIFMLGGFTDNVVTTLGTIASFTDLIRDFYAGPVANSRLFDFAAGNFPDIFSGIPVAGTLDQYDYRFYPQSGNYLAIDNAGMLYILGPYSNNTLLRIGEVGSLKTAITTWEAGR